MTDHMKRYIHEGGAFKAAIVNTTHMGQDIYKRLSPSPIGLQLLSQAMTGALLMTSGLKSEGTISITAVGNGPGQSLTAEANTVGDVRATMGDFQVQFMPERSLGLFQQTIGAGKLSVTRRTKKTPTPYRSVVELVEGELALNLANYMLRSDQTASAIQLGTTLDAELGVAGSGGIMIQALPGADENLLFVLEQRLQEIAPLGELFAGEDGMEKVLDFMFSDIELQHMVDQPVRFFCPCSRQRMIQVLGSLAVEELLSMRAEDREHEVSCSFCNAAYPILPEDLDVLIEIKKGG